MWPMMDASTREVLWEAKVNLGERDDITSTRELEKKTDDSELIFPSFHFVYESC